jgi:hypothetical protein
MKERLRKRLVDKIMLTLFGNITLEINFKTTFSVSYSWGFLRYLQLKDYGILKIKLYRKTLSFELLPKRQPKTRQSFEGALVKIWRNKFISNRNLRNYLNQLLLELLKNNELEKIRIYNKVYILKFRGKEPNKFKVKALGVK